MKKTNTNVALVLRETGKAATKKSKSKKTDGELELQLISIRLPKALVETLKTQASKQGIGYQPFVRQILMNQVNGFSEEHPGFQRMLDKIEERFTATEAAVSTMRKQLKRSSSKFARQVTKGLQAAGRSR